jgi:2-C-methyl-D-erythritol 2,4-cyclodiphosphate synthase
VGGLIKKKNFTIRHLDTVVIAQEPILSPFKRQMQEAIAKILNIEEERVNVKAKTNEGLGEIGRKEAIAAYAVALIAKGE